MPRRARVVFPHVPHHVTQRGNHRLRVFFDRSDGAAYLRLLAAQTEQYEIEIVAYCLMPNHVHLVLVPSTSRGLHLALKVVHGRYAQRINRMRGQVGHLWQNRYFSSALDSDYFLNAVRYVELNPVRAKLVGCAQDYEWSSAAVHCGETRPSIVSRRPRSALFSGIDDWSSWLAAGVPQPLDHVLRKYWQRNLPCGSDEFVAELEHSIGHPLRYRERGRPTEDECVETQVSVPFLEE